jgi:hypothetical protein
VIKLMAAVYAGAAAACASTASASARASSFTPALVRGGRRERGIGEIER